MLLIARLRGAFVGAIAWTASIAGHGLGGGSMSLTSASVLLLCLASVAVGATVSPAQVRRNDWMPLLTVLGAGQLIGHVVLTLSHGHAMTSSLPSPTMLTGHLVVLVATAIMLRYAARGLILSFGLLLRFLRALGGVAAPTPLWVTVFPPNNWACRFLLWCATAGTRGPPVPA